MSKPDNKRNSENSVMAALAALCRLEDERVAEQAAAAEQRQIEIEEARRLEEQERARQAARVETEARARVEAELRRRDAEAEGRIAALRAELSAVQASREATLMELLARQQIQPARRSRPVFGIAALVAVAVALVIGGAAFLRSGDGRAAEPGAVAPVIDLAAPTPAVETNAEPEPVVAVAVPDEPAPVVDAKPGKGAGVKRPGKGVRGAKADTAAKPPKDDDLGSLDKCGDDPLCGGLGGSLGK
jgi:hypothetical protein